MKESLKIFDSVEGFIHELDIFRTIFSLIVLYFCLSMGSRSPASSSQPPAFFSKLTESNSAIVKSKKEMIKKMVVGAEAEFSKFMRLDQFFVVVFFAEKITGIDVHVCFWLKGLKLIFFCFPFRPGPTWDRNLQHACLYKCR